MFAVIYKFKLKPHQEELYKIHWNKIARYFINHRGAIGSCLHQGENHTWVAYSRWPNKATRDNSWPGEHAPNNDLPDEIRDSIHFMQAIKAENGTSDIAYEELCLTVVEDFLLTSPGDSLEKYIDANI